MGSSAAHLILAGTLAMVILAYLAICALEQLVYGDRPGKDKR